MPFFKRPDVEDDSRFFSFSTPTLEAKQRELEELRASRKIASQRHNEEAELIVKVRRLRERIAFITRRNKEREILILPLVHEDNPLTHMLLNANSNATAQFARTWEEGLAMLQVRAFDMIYIVMDFAAEGHGPCFLSLDHPGDDGLRKENSELISQAPDIRRYSGDAEIVIVCGTSQECCPISRKLFEEDSGFFKV